MDRKLNTAPGIARVFSAVGEALKPFCNAIVLVFVFIVGNFD
jgi:hypothetical protein